MSACVLVCVAKAAKEQVEFQSQQNIILVEERRRSLFSLAVVVVVVCSYGTYYPNNIVICMNMCSCAGWCFFC